MAANITKVQFPQNQHVLNSQKAEISDSDSDDDFSYDLHATHNSSVLQSKPPEMPSCAELVFHWSLTRGSRLPEPLLDRVKQIESARVQIAMQDLNDAENWLILSQSEMLLSKLEDSYKCLSIASKCRPSESMSVATRRKLSILLLHQDTSLLMWSREYMSARLRIDKLFEDEGASPENYALRASLEMHCALAARENITQVVEHYSAAVEDLKAARTLNPAVVEVCLKSVQKRLRIAEETLFKIQVFVSKTLRVYDLHDAPELGSVVIQVDLALGFTPDHNLADICLYATAEKLCRVINDKKLTVNQFVKGPSLPFLIYRVLHATSSLGSKRKTGIFTSRTNLTLIPGQEIVSRSQLSLFYAIGCQGPLGQIWQKRLKEICFGGGATWLCCTMNGRGAEYFAQLDKAVRQNWDSGVSSLFRNLLVFQSGVRIMKQWHIGTNLASWKSDVLVEDASLLRNYLDQFSHHTVGIICTRFDEDMVGHSVAAVINPPITDHAKKPPFAYYYDFNQSRGDLNIQSIGSLALYLLSGLECIEEGPIAIQVYGLKSENPPLLAPEKYWIEEVMGKQIEKMMKTSSTDDNFMGKVLRHANLLGDDLQRAWEDYLLKSDSE